MNNGQGPRRRPGKNVFTTKSGTSIKLNRSFTERRRALKDARARRRAAYLSTLPKNPAKRLLYRLHPKRVFQYWFSREGAITALKITGVGIAVCFLLLVGLFAYFRKDVPSITDVKGNDLPGSISYYDRSASTLLWQDYDVAKRIPVLSGNISPYIKNATVAIEDKGFYHEGAFNVRGIVRAASHDVLGKGQTLQGGSTITQQLVKLNRNWTSDRSIARKIKELILAVELEREYSKDDILTGYLNIAPYGGIEYGAESAARDYFHSNAKDLTLGQATMLSAIPQSPAYYSPYSTDFDKEALTGRMHYILDLMVEQKMITKQQAAAAKAEDVIAQAQAHPLQAKYQGIVAPYFVIAAKQELQNKYGAETVKRGGWKITTTLNLDLQHLAEKKIADNLPNVKRAGGDQEAMVAEDVKTGQMVALVGGVDFSNPDYGQINYAQTPLPPGSSFKPYDYTALINYNKNVGAGSVLYDTQGVLPGYPCTDKSIPINGKGGGNCLQDYDFHYPGALTLRYALAGSRNVPAVKAMLTVGTDKVINMAESMMGNPHAYNCYSDTALTKTAPCYGASAIGDGAYLHLDDHVNGLATLGRLGNFIPRTYILHIEDASGKSIYKWTQPKPQQVVSADAAYIVNDMLSDPKASYLPSYGGYKFQNYNGWKFAVKTGTTNDNYDGLMTSWSTQYAVVSWVGYHTRNVALHSGGMELLTTPLTRGFMQAAHDALHTTPANWQKPTEIKTAPAYVVRSHVGVGSIEPSPNTDIYPSWYQPKSQNGSSATIDRISNKLATDCTPSLARQYITNGNANQFSVDQFVNGGSANSNSSVNTTASDDVHQCGDQKPTISLTVASDTTGSSANTCDRTGCTITATVSQGTHPLASSQFPGKVTLTINGQPGTSFDVNGADSPQKFSYHYVPASSGSLAVSAQIVDSVLYDSTVNATVVATGPPDNNNPPTNPLQGLLGN